MIEIKKILNDGGCVEGIKIVYRQNQPPKTELIFKKLTVKEIRFLENQLIIQSRLILLDENS